MTVKAQLYGRMPTLVHADARRTVRPYVGPLLAVGGIALVALAVKRWSKVEPTLTLLPSVTPTTDPPGAAVPKLSVEEIGAIMNELTPEEQDQVIATWKALAKAKVAKDHGVSLAASDDRKE